MLLAVSLQQPYGLLLRILPRDLQTLESLDMRHGRSFPSCGWGEVLLQLDRDFDQVASVPWATPGHLLQRLWLRWLPLPAWQRLLLVEVASVTSSVT